jgi:hypothetical protein
MPGRGKWGEVSGTCLLQRYRGLFWDTPSSLFPIVTCRRLHLLSVSLSDHRTEPATPPILPNSIPLSLRYYRMRRKKR